MKKSRYTDTQIIAILKQNESGISVSDLCREHGMSQASFYQWRLKPNGTKTYAKDSFLQTKADC